MPDPAPANLAVPFNTAAQIPLSNVFLNSTYGDYTGLETVTMPTTYSGTTATYTPTTGQTGTDSFTYRAVRGANAFRVARIPAPSPLTLACRSRYSLSTIKELVRARWCHPRLV